MKLTQVAVDGTHHPAVSAPMVAQCFPTGRLRCKQEMAFPGKRPGGDTQWPSQVLRGGLAVLHAAQMRAACGDQLVRLPDVG